MGTRRYHRPVCVRRPSRRRRGRASVARRVECRLSVARRGDVGLSRGAVAIRVRQGTTQAPIVTIRDGQTGASGGRDPLWVLLGGRIGHGTPQKDTKIDFARRTRPISATDRDLREGRGGGDPGQGSPWL
ncbi:hypothetical protein FAIPA1_50169 [Frankia sp. AiPs1]